MKPKCNLHKSDMRWIMTSSNSRKRSDIYQCTECYQKKRIDYEYSRTDEEGIDVFIKTRERLD